MYLQRYLYKYNSLYYNCSKVKTQENNIKGLMSDNGFSYPSYEELRNIFAASCVESVAIALGSTTADIYRRMKAVNLFADLIYPCYETLHTQSRNIVTEDILEALHRRESKKGIII